jgi:hypothetical protein
MSVCSNDRREESGVTLGDDLRGKRGGVEWRVEAGGARTTAAWLAHLGTKEAATRTSTVGHARFLTVLGIGRWTTRGKRRAQLPPTGGPSGGVSQ